MKLVVSKDIDKKVINDICNQLNISDDVIYQLQKSEETGSLVKIIGEIFEWHSLLKIALTAFMIEITREAAKDVYKNKVIILQTLKNSAVKPLKNIVKLIKRTKKECPTNTRIVICLPILDEIIGTELNISDEAEIIIAWKLANYFYKADQIKNFEIEYMRNSKYPMGKVYVEVNEDGSILLQWFNKNDVGIQEKTIK